MKLLKVLSIIGVIVIITYLYMYNQISVFRIKNIRIGSNKIVNSIKITQISDFHSNHLIDLDKLVDEIESFNPDFIVLTGDMIDYKDTNLDTVFRLFKSIGKLNKDIYFIHGNHETNHRLYDGFRGEMESLGITILENSSKTIKVHDQNIILTGLNFSPPSRVYEESTKYQEAIKNLNLDFYNILLVHSPNNVEKLLSGKEDLILSGHTHGGQFRLPVIGSIVAPGQGFFPKFDKGIFEIGSSTLYIDSGLGNSVAPIRGFNPVQFSNITIESKSLD